MERGKCGGVVNEFERSEFLLFVLKGVLFVGGLWGGRGGGCVGGEGGGGGGPDLLLEMAHFGHFNQDPSFGRFFWHFFGHFSRGPYGRVGGSGPVKMAHFGHFELDPYSVRFLLHFYGRLQEDRLGIVRKLWRPPHPSH